MFQIDEDIMMQSLDPIDPQRDAEQGDGVRVTLASSQAAIVDDKDYKDLDAVNLDTTDTQRLTRLMFEDIITVHEGTALKLYHTCPRLQ
eukprot:scaffold201474_cov86-Cyclotella_meneghiniana.AAC.1